MMPKGDCPHCGHPLRHHTPKDDERMAAMRGYHGGGHCLELDIPNKGLCRCNGTELVSKYMTRTDLDNLEADAPHLVSMLRAISGLDRER